MSEHTIQAELAAAFVAAQGNIKKAVRGRDNTFTGSKYAELSDVVDACMDALNAEGIGVVQRADTVDKEAQMLAVVETMLVHTSGAYLSSTLHVPCTKRDAQGVGSAITYARRYALAAMAGVAPDDDDGNAADAKTAKPPRKRGEKVTDDEAATLHDLCQQAGIDPAQFATWLDKAETIEAIKGSQYERGVAALEKRIRDSA